MIFVFVIELFVHILMGAAAVVMMLCTLLWEALLHLAALFGMGPIAAKIRATVEAEARASRQAEERRQQEREAQERAARQKAKAEADARIQAYKEASHPYSDERLRMFASLIAATWAAQDNQRPASPEELRIGRWLRENNFSDSQPLAVIPPYTTNSREKKYYHAPLVTPSTYPERVLDELEEMVYHNLIISEAQKNRFHAMYEDTLEGTLGGTPERQPLRPYPNLLRRN